EDASALAGVPVALPALQRAARVAAKAISAGFKWDDAAGALAKVREEARELDEAFEGGDRARIEAELGDLLLATAFFGQYLRLDRRKAAGGSRRGSGDGSRGRERGLGDRLGASPLEERRAAGERAKAAMDRCRPASRPRGRAGRRRASRSRACASSSRRT